MVVTPNTWSSRAVSRPIFKVVSLGKGGRGVDLRGRIPAQEDISLA
jgi:hypothetical protein